MNELIPEERKQRPWDVYGFWAVENTLVPWFRCLACVIREREEVPEWLGELRDWWELFDEGWGGGSVFDRSEKFVTTAARKKMMLDLSAITLERLLNHGGDFYAAFPVTLPKCDCATCRAPLSLSEKVGIFEIGTNYARLLAGMKNGQWPEMTIGYLEQKPDERE